MDSNKKLTRKRQRNVTNWKSEVAKRLRNTGQSYTSKKLKKVIPARKIGPPCGEKCRLKCSANVSEEERKNIFSEYYNLGNITMQRQYIINSTTLITPKYKYTNAANPRQNNNAFYFSVQNNKIRVCKTFFKSTLALNDRVIRTAFQKRMPSMNNIVAVDGRGKHENHAKIPDIIKSEIREHIQSIPAMDSHYCRSNTNKLYIDGSKTMTDLHKDYVKLCQIEYKPYGNYVLYSHIFNNEFNIAFYSPKKDRCDTCEAFMNATGEEKQRLQVEYDTHLVEKELSRAEKEQDKMKGSRVVVAVYDLQATMPCPRGDVSNFYYISKVNVLNFTITDLKTKDVYCNVWHEGHGNRGVNEIATCVWNYLNQIDTKADQSIDVIFYSDNCCGQQKNRFMISMYMLAVNRLKNIRSITHKFPIKGHTQNAGDNCHSLIERKIKKSLRSAAIYSPAQYFTLIRTAKSNGKPFAVSELTYDSFYDFKEVSPKIGKNFSKNIQNESVKMNDISIIYVSKSDPGTFFYKTSYSDTSYKQIKVTGSTRSTQNDLLTPNLPAAYSERIKITSKKKQGLLKLVEKNIIPKYYEDFYQNL